MIKDLLAKIAFPKVYLNKSKALKVFENKTILITGASDGIGRECALLLSKFNTNLILVARSEDKLQKLKSEISQNGSQATIFNCNLYHEVDQLIQYLNTDFTSIDLFISNAGKSIKRSLIDSLDRYHDFTRTNSLNYLAPVKICLAICPILSKQHGQIVNVSALNVLLPAASNWSAYQASKTAFDQWCRSNLSEFKSLNIRLKTIYLPLVNTKMISPNEAYQNIPAMDKTEAALRILKLLVNDKNYSKPWWSTFPIFIGQLVKNTWSKF